MNTNQQTPTGGRNSGIILEPEMANLLQMTNQVVMKIKLQTREMYL